MTPSATMLLARDAALPQRDALLDTGVVAGRIGRLMSAAGPVTIERCDRLRVNYQIGKSLRVLHRVDVAGTSWTISARAFRDGRGHRACHEARAGALPCDGVRPVFHDAELDTVFWVFPNDRKISRLAAVASGDLSPRDGLPLVWQSARLMAYAPEKSATLACLDERGRIVAYAKVSAHDQTERDYHRYRALQESVTRNPRNPHLRLPRALAYLPNYRLLLLEAIDGRRMDDATGARKVQDATRFGAALAAFHELTPRGAPGLTRFASDRLIEARRLVAHVRPDVEDLADALVCDLISRPPDATELVCLHGDVHPKNAIVTDREIALIDVEDLATGPAAADLGSFLAGLLYLWRGARLAAETHDTVASAFLVGYASVRPLPTRAALRWYTSAALLIERILRALTRVRPLGLLHLPELLGDARALLTDSHDDDLEPRALP
jgi:tRNA A-37 threonylcarbamoyl transferase component Bud32